MCSPSLASEVPLTCETPAAGPGISFAYVAHVGSGLPVTFCEAYSQHFPEGMWAGVYSYQHPDFLPDSYYDPAWLHPAMGAVAKPM